MSSNEGNNLLLPNPGPFQQVFAQLRASATAATRHIGNDARQSKTSGSSTDQARAATAVQQGNVAGSDLFLPDYLILWDNVSFTSPTKPDLQKNDPLSPNEVLSAVLLPRGFTVPLYFVSSHVPEHSLWHGFLSRQGLDVLDPDRAALWRCLSKISIILSQNDITWDRKVAFASKLLEEYKPAYKHASAAFCSAMAFILPQAEFLQPPFQSACVSDVILHFVQSLLRFCAQQSVLSPSDIKLLDNISQKDGFSSPVYEVTSFMQRFPRHVVPGFLFVLLCGRPHPFVSLANNNSLIAYYIKKMDERGHLSSPPVATTPLLKETLPSPVTDVANSLKQQKNPGIGKHSTVGNGKEEKSLRNEDIPPKRQIQTEAIQAEVGGVSHSLNDKDKPPAKRLRVEEQEYGSILASVDNLPTVCDSKDGFSKKERARENASSIKGYESEEQPNPTQRQVKVAFLPSVTATKQATNHIDAVTWQSKQQFENHDVGRTEACSKPNYWSTVLGKTSNILTVKTRVEQSTAKSVDAKVQASTELLNTSRDNRHVNGDILGNSRVLKANKPIQRLAINVMKSNKEENAKAPPQLTQVVPEAQEAKTTDRTDTDLIDNLWESILALQKENKKQQDDMQCLLQIVGVMFLFCLFFFFAALVGFK